MSFLPSITPLTCISNFFLPDTSLFSLSGTPWFSILFLYILWHRIRRHLAGRNDCLSLERLSVFHSPSGFVHLHLLHHFTHLPLCPLTNPASASRSDSWCQSSLPWSLEDYHKTFALPSFNNFFPFAVKCLPRIESLTFCIINGGSLHHWATVVDKSKTLSDTKDFNNITESQNIFFNGLLTN